MFRGTTRRFCYLDATDRGDLRAHGVSWAQIAGLHLWLPRAFAARAEASTTNRFSLPGTCYGSAELSWPRGSGRSLLYCDPLMLAVIAITVSRRATQRA